MIFSRASKYLIQLSKVHRFQYRCISDVQKKISQSYYYMHGDLQLSCSRLGDVLNKGADECGDRTAVVSVHQGISKNYMELRNEAKKLASGLISLGLKKGDRIAIYSPNCYEWPLTQFAAAKAGLILVNINPASQPVDLEYCLKKVDCKAIVMWDVAKTQDFYSILCKVTPELPTSTPGKLKSKNLPSLETVIMISDIKKDGVFNFKDVLNSGNKESDRLLSVVSKNIQFEDPVNVIFTSGTTGSPKGATLTHHNIINNALVTGRRIGYNLLRPVLCCHVPLFHSFGCVHGSVATLFYQGTIVLPTAGYDAISSLKAIEEYKCTTVYGTPTMYVDLLNNCKHFKSGSLKQAILGGASSPEQLIRDIRDILKIPHIHVGYGITETSPAVALNGLNDDFENVVKGVLQPIEYGEVKVVDDNNHLVPINTQGEVCARGHNRFLKYWNDVERTAEVVDETNWFHTGDLAVMNEYGFIKIVGRKKDIIIRGGENIYPLEVENYLSTHPAILEVHICGVPDKRMGEEACAWISVKNDMNLTEEEVKAFCKEKISHYKIPRYIMFVKEFPKTLSGKVKKFEMTRLSIEKLKL